MAESAQLGLVATQEAQGDFAAAKTQYQQLASAHPNGYTTTSSHTNSKGVFVPGGAPQVLAVPLSGTTFVAGMNAFLNISYTFIGQITLPSFIAEMKNPLDFGKALWVVTIAEVILFSLAGAIGT